jgi:hypothetical protein
MKIEESGKRLAGAVVICTFWRLAVVLSLLVVPSCLYVFNKPRSPIHNPSIVAQKS